MTTAEKLTVMLVDDHELIRQGLAGAFARAGGFEVVGQAGSVKDAIEQARACGPDVVITDVRLPDGSGLDIVRTLRAERPEVGIVVLTMHAGDDQIFAAMDAGASAFVGKHAPSTDVITAARQAATAPRTFACAELAQAMVRRLTSTAPRLTEREHDVLQLLAEGLGNSAIAAQLYISESTAKAHVARIYEKVGATNRAQALMAALRLGLLGEDLVG
ncbi:MAG TPA: response regulator transcription factor [Marmoricola sp.]